MMNKKPMSAGMKALKKKAPKVAKKMGYNKGGSVPNFKMCEDCPTPKQCSAAGKCMGKKAKMYKGGMAKKKSGYAKGGMVTKANCGASMKPGQKRGK